MVAAVVLFLIAVFNIVDGSITVYRRSYRSLRRGLLSKPRVILVQGPPAVVYGIGYIISGILVLSLSMLRFTQRITIDVLGAFAIGIGISAVCVLTFFFISLLFWPSDGFDGLDS